MRRATLDRVQGRSEQSMGGPLQGRLLGAYVRAASVCNVCFVLGACEDWPGGRSIVGLFDRIMRIETPPLWLPCWENSGSHFSFLFSVMYSCE